ncbi:hypothetical protein TNCV_4177221 [Trichonephila clavipes]|nr:hypothetical protein TNCV_4177221 [Trichonephila clavipes]
MLPPPSGKSGFEHQAQVHTWRQSDFGPRSAEVAGYCRQEEEAMDWEDAPVLPEVSAPFVPSRPHGR